ncbi:MAG: hypothetical protein ACSHW7_02175 [Patiriisocius sp.]|uniref:hypothetical protein n=1 Tax=Patiriisocius sp. TaxID=2822396 RepID=UPI003EF6D256
MFQFCKKLFLLCGIVLLISCEEQIHISTPPFDNTSIDSLYIKEKLENNDSLLNLSLIGQIKSQFKKKNWEEFNSYRFQHLSLTERLNDTFANAKTLEYSGAYFKQIHQLDSSYYYYDRSFEKYALLSDSLRAGSMLLNKAIIQKNVRDYRGSEITSFKALKFLFGTNQRRIASVYNNLGIIYNQLNDEELSIKYHTLAKNLRKTFIDSPILYYHSINNIGKVYADNNKYDEAISNYRIILENDSLLDTSLKLKAIVIDNNAYAHYKNGDSTSTKADLKKALIIRESINDLNGSIINCIHLAEYSVAQKDTLTALFYAEKAEKFSQTTNNYRDYLRSIKLLSSLYPRKEAVEHFNKYIRIRDSLDKVALAYEKSFERIEFEVNQKENVISQQKEEIDNKSRVINGTIIGCLVLIMILIYRKAKAKKKAKLLREITSKDFREYLIGKYSLSKKNIEFWELWVTKLNQEEMANKLFITIEAVVSRRKSLRNRINKVQKINGNFDQSRAIIIWNKEKEIHAST